MSCTKAIQERIVQILNWDVTPGDFETWQYRPTDHGVMMTNGEYRVFREAGIQQNIDRKALDGLPGGLGGEGFMNRFVEPAGLLFAGYIRESMMTSFGSPVLLCRQFKPQKPSSAPYHWVNRFEWKGIPFEVVAFIQKLHEPTLVLQYRTILGVFESE